MLSTGIILGLAEAQRYLQIFFNCFQFTCDSFSLDKLHSGVGDRDVLEIDGIVLFLKR